MIYKKLKKVSTLPDHSALDVPIDTTKIEKIYGFYHVFCANDWKRLVCEQIAGLKKNGLYDLLNKIYVCVITTNSDDVHFLTEHFPEKFEIVIQSNNPKDYEYPILRYLHEKSRCENFLCFYFHTKGVRFSEKMKKEKRGQESWRLLMEYFIFEKYNLAINALQRGYSCYGAIPHTMKGYTFFAGNFWWTTSKYVTTLPEPSSHHTLYDQVEIGVNDRMYAEHWIGHSSACNPYNTYSSFVDYYYIPIPDVLYKSRNIKVSHLLPIIKFYFAHIMNCLFHRFKIGK